MARGELLGLCNCPECGFPDAEVRPDKSGSPYRFCPDCTAQYFSRGNEQKKANLLKQIRKRPEAAPPVIAGGAVTGTASKEALPATVSKAPALSGSGFLGAVSNIPPPAPQLPKVKPLAFDLGAL